VAIAPLLIRIRTAGAAALGRTAAQLRAMAAAVRAAAARAAAAARTTSTYTAALGRLAAALRRVAVAALAAARAIGGPLVRALRSAARAAGNLMQALAKLAARWAVLGGLGFAFLVPAVGLVGNLLGALQLLAPAIVAIVAGVATWKMAMSGFSDALNADNTEDLADALKKLSPTARQAALTLRDLRAEWKSTQQRVQNAFFKGARDDFIMLSRAIQPVADRWLPKLATAFGNLRRWISQVFAAAADSGQLDRIMAGVQRFVDGLTAAIPYLVQAFLDIAEVAAPSFGDLGDKMSSAAQRFAEWIRMLKDNGTLKAWLDKAKETFGKLMDIGKEIGRVFQAIFKGSDAGSFLDNLKNSISNLADWLGSDDGQSVIKFFGDVGSAIAGVIVWIEKVVGFFQRGWNSFREATEGLRNSLTGAFSAIGAGMGGMLAIIAGGSAAFGWIGGVVSRLGGLVGAVRGAVSGINAALAAIRTTVFIDIITRRFEGSKGYAKPITSSAGGAPKFYAKGGPVAKGQPIVVGDGGRPELFVPDSAGRILPRVPTGGTAAGGGNVNVALSIAPAAGHGSNPLVAAVIQMFRDRKIVLRDSKGQAVRLAGA
jgi:hypothetical protein